MRKKQKYFYFYLILPIIGIIIWILEKHNMITSYYLQIFMLICINIILTTSLNLINGFCGQLSLGHASFMAIGAYASCIFTTIIPKVYPKIYFISNFNLIFKGGIFFFSLLIGGIIGSLVAWLVSLPILRLRGDYLAIGTLAFGEVVRATTKLSDEIATFFKNIGFEKIAQLIMAVDGPRGLSGIPKLTNIFWVVSLTIITVFIINRLVQSSYGRAWKGIREDEIAADMMGIDITKYKLLAFSMAGFFAGIGGGLYAHILMFIHPDNFSFIKSIEYVVYLCLGGMGSIFGAIISSSVVTFLLEFLRIIGLQQWRLVIYPLILLLIMLTKAEGFFKKEI